MNNTYFLLLIPLGVACFIIMASNFKKADPNKEIASNYYLWMVLVALFLIMTVHYFSLPFYIFICYFIILFFA